MYFNFQTQSQYRLRSLETLLTFIEMAAGEMAWLNEKEEIEVSRDWSSQNVSLQELDQHIEVAEALSIY